MKIRTMLGCLALVAALSSSTLTATQQVTPPAGEVTTATREFRRMTDDAVAGFTVHVFVDAAAAFAYELSLRDRMPENDPDFAEVSFPDMSDGTQFAVYRRHPNPAVAPRMDFLEVTISDDIFVYVATVLAPPDVILALAIEAAESIFIYSSTMFEGAARWIVTCSTSSDTHRAATGCQSTPN